MRSPHRRLPRFEARCATFGTEPRPPRCPLVGPALRCRHRGPLCLGEATAQAPSRAPEETHGGAESTPSGTVRGQAGVACRRARGNPERAAVGWGLGPAEPGSFRCPGPSADALQILPVHAARCLSVRFSQLTTASDKGEPSRAVRYPAACPAARAEAPALLAPMHGQVVEGLPGRRDMRRPGAAERWSAREATRTLKGTRRGGSFSTWGKVPSVRLWRGAASLLSGGAPVSS